MRNATFAFRLTGGLLFVSWAAKIVAYVAYPAFHVSGSISNLGTSGLVAIGLAWAASAPTGLAATRRWLLVIVAGIAVTVASIEYLLSQPVDFTFTGWHSGHDDFAPVNQYRIVGVLTLGSGALGQLVLAFSLLPLWGPLARLAALPDTPRWTVVLATAPLWVKLVIGAIDDRSVRLVITAASLAWLIWALVRERATRAEEPIQVA